MKESKKRTTGLASISQRISAYAIHVKHIKRQEGFLMREEVDSKQVDFLKKSLLQRVIDTKGLHNKPYGIKEPITGFYKNGYFMLNHGHHRHQAVLELWEDKDGKIAKLLSDGVLDESDLDRIYTIPATVSPPPIGRDEQETSFAEACMFLAQITDNSGKNYSPLDCARTVKKVHEEYGLSFVQISKILHVEQSVISNWMRLTHLPETVQNNIQGGDIAATLTLELVREHGQEKAVSLIEDAIKRGKNQGKKRVTKKDIEGSSDSTKMTKRQIKNLLETMDQKPLDDGWVAVDAKVLEAVLTFFQK